MHMAQQCFTVVKNVRVPSLKKDIISNRINAVAKAI